MDIFTYTQDELDRLSRKDKKLAAVIKEVGRIERPVNKDIFAALIDSIVSQQISGKAAETVWKRLLTFLGEITPETIQSTPIEEIQKCGMSMRKAEYIKSTAAAAFDGRLEIGRLQAMSDEQVIEHLSALPGIGVWTAEMLLIFSLERRDVLSYGDLAIRRGICKLYGHKELDRARFARYQKRYSPFGSIASLYLWRISVD
ncbi:MAG: DNA-3-methyladenine glycosylase [Oscillospiraceae bacterium]|nr:DNA-3-methyladenine glycosylase [Oscillospiraceae bacterium]